jgi:hypothetical protein
MTAAYWYALRAAVVFFCGRMSTASSRGDASVLPPHFFPAPLSALTRRLQR